MELTELEKQTLEDITNDNFYEDGLDSILWSDCFMQDGTTIGARKCRDGTISFTDAGKELMIELGYE
nr:MAG TPA: hypothetical protein [Caudoviricetes sp.]